MVHQEGSHHRRRRMNDRWHRPSCPSSKYDHETRNTSLRTRVSAINIQNRRYKYLYNCHLQLTTLLDASKISIKTSTSFESLETDMAIYCSPDIEHPLYSVIASRQSLSVNVNRASILLRFGLMSIFSPFHISELSNEPLARRQLQLRLEAPS